MITDYLKRVIDPRIGFLLCFVGAVIFILIALHKRMTAFFQDGGPVPFYARACYWITFALIMIVAANISMTILYL